MLLQVLRCIVVVTEKDSVSIVEDLNLYMTSKHTQLSLYRSVTITESLDQIHHEPITIISNLPTIEHQQRVKYTCNAAGSSWCFIINE